MDLKEIVWEGMGWIHLAQYRDKLYAFLVMVMKLWLPFNGELC
jgi:hypothetical protein